MKMTMTATGDTILIQGFPEGGYAGYDRICRYIGKGQARFGNLETCVTDFSCYPSYISGGTWMNTNERVLDQILSFGMNFMGFANNHTLDFGPQGLLQTVENLYKRGVATAGAGRNLFEASKPVFRDFEGGRVAFIAVTSIGTNPAAMAGDASRSLPGRPGSNGLHYATKMRVPKEDIEILNEIAESTGINARDALSRKNGFLPPLPEGAAAFGSMMFYPTEGESEKFTYCNKRDLARILDAIKDASYIADYTVIMFHAHEIKGLENNKPADFHKEFAHACIDAGACAVIGGGTHELKPIEIYNGKPIFYSLGDFCFQSNIVERQAPDMLDKFNLPALSDIQALATKNKNWTRGHHTQKENFRTVIPYFEFEDGKMTHLELLPVDLGFEKPRTFKGLPYVSEGEIAEEIFQTLDELSTPYGTRLSMQDGVIRVALD